MAFTARLKKYPTYQEIAAIGLSHNIERDRAILSEVFDGTWKDCDIYFNQRQELVINIDQYEFPESWCHVVQLEAE